MERLTKKNDYTGSWTYNTKYIPAHNIRHKQCVDKLGELEDIEEDLGVDLVKLLSAKSIFVVECDEIYESQTPFVDCVNKQILLAHYTTITDDYDFKDYGK